MAAKKKSNDSKEKYLVVGTGFSSPTDALSYIENQVEAELETSMRAVEIAADDIAGETLDDYMSGEPTAPDSGDVIGTILVLKVVKLYNVRVEVEDPTAIAEEVKLVEL